MSSNSKKAEKNAILLIVYQIVTIGFGLIIPRITITGYSSEVNGLLNSVNQIISYLILFEAGIQAVAKKTLYKTLSENDVTSTNMVLSAVNKNYKKIGTYYLITLLAFSVIYPIFTVSKTLDFLTIFLIVFFSGIGNVVSFYYQGKYRILLEADGKTYFLTTISMIVTIINQIVKVILLLNSVDIKFVILSTTCISMLQIIFISVYINKRYRWISLKEEPDYKALKQSKYAFLHQISAQIFAHTDVLLLTFVCGLKVVSVYTIYKMIVYYIRTILAIPYDSTIFAMGQLYNKDRERYKQTVDGLHLFMTVSVFSIFTVTYYMLLPFLRIYTRGVTDINYINVYLPFLFIFGEILNIIRSPFNSTINFAGHFKETVWRSVLETSINLTVSIIGVFFLGIKGVLLGTIIALLYRTTDIVVYANNKILERSSKRSLVVFVLNFILFASIGYGMARIDFNANSYFDLIKIGALTTPCVLIVFALFNLLIFKQERILLIDTVKGFIKKKVGKNVIIRK